ncbi:MAG: 1-deoxy-D-xylulose-5-phosphate reductoisomerase [Lachnospiraceae bacterium]|nr:1-deoxy-D-xylulose-5-phosphate reductoisomerase [Lachnospiraceae bacterium]
MKKIAVLGSTGSIGTQTLEIVRERVGEFQVTALAAGSNIDLLEAQVAEFRPKLVSLTKEEDARELEARLRRKNMDSTEVVWGMEGLVACATESSADMTVNAVVGMIGILPTIAAIKAGKDIALANKETLVTAGHIIMPLVEEYKVKLLPVDSEHSAVFQCLQGAGAQTVEKLLLTASGGPFFGKTKEELGSITVEQALKHPNWAMGRKITIDSSTLVNKGLEVMEAGRLFSLRPEQIEVVVQPKSIIHSMIQFDDGAVLAQLGVPDMKLPIQYAMTYPNRVSLGGERLNFFDLQKIEFYKPDTDTFRALALAYEAFAEGGSLPTVYNAANEMAVALFLERKIGYLQITELLERAMDAHKKIKNPTLEEVLSTEAETYSYIREFTR